MTLPRIIELIDGTALLRCRQAYYDMDAEQAETVGLSPEQNVRWLATTLDLTRNVPLNWAECRHFDGCVSITFDNGETGTFDLSWETFDATYTTYLIDRPMPGLN